MAIKLNLSRQTPVMSALFNKRGQKKAKALFQSSPALIPVFFLPHNDLSTIPEEAEIHQGFFVNMSIEPHYSCNRRFSGLKSLSEIDKKAMERSAATSVEYRSFSCSARAA